MLSANTYMNTTNKIPLRSKFNCHYFFAGGEINFSVKLKFNYIFLLSSSAVDDLERLIARSGGKLQPRVYSESATFVASMYEVKLLRFLKKFCCLDMYT